MGIFNTKPRHNGQDRSSIDEILDVVGMPGQDPQMIATAFLNLGEEQLAAGNATVAARGAYMGVRILRELHSSNPPLHHDQLADGLLLAAAAYGNSANYEAAEQHLAEIIGATCTCPGRFRNVPQALTVWQALLANQGRLAEARGAADLLSDLARQYPAVAEYVAAQQQLQNRQYAG